MRTIVTIVALAACSINGGCSIFSGWTQKSSSSSGLPALRGHVMAWDATHNGRALLFGGDSADPNGGTPASNSTTWTWDGTAWTNASPISSPSPRDEAAIASETTAVTATAADVLLFGGFTSTGMSAETWEWDGSNWTEVNLPLDPNNTPSARHFSAMAFDGHGTVVLFGGIDSTGERDDTWLWNITTKKWTQAQPTTHPSARAGHAMAYDADGDRVVLFGGGTANASAYYNDTYAWNGSNWILIDNGMNANAPSKRVECRMAYDAPNKQIVLFGGLVDVAGTNSITFLNDTLALKGSTWSPLSQGFANLFTGVPTARYEHAMTANPHPNANVGQIILYGGVKAGTPTTADPHPHGVLLGDTWVRHP